MSDVITSERVTIPKIVAPINAPCFKLFFVIRSAIPSVLTTLAMKSGKTLKKKALKPSHSPLGAPNMALNIFDKRNKTRVVVTAVVASDRADCCFRL